MPENLPMESSIRDLFAPCGMFCGFCTSYLSYKYKIPKRRGIISYCIGCRPRNKQCSFVKKRCNILLNHELDSCYDCDQYPCNILDKIESNYLSKATYSYSFQQSNREIHEHSPEYVVERLKKEHGCPKCGEILCIHNGLCYNCEKETLAVMKNYRNNP